MQRVFEKIVERLENIVGLMNDDAENMIMIKGSVDAYVNAIKIVNQVALEYGSGWIPVEERLPDEEEYLKNDGMFIVTDGDYVYETMFDICNSRFCEDYFSITPSRDACIIAWQPLPEVYKNGEEREDELV